jgi:hypothetical protein
MKVLAGLTPVASVESYGVTFMEKLEIMRLMRTPSSGRWPVTAPGGKLTLRDAANRIDRAVERRELRRFLSTGRRDRHGRKLARRAIITLRRRGQNDELRIGKSCHRDTPLR